MGKTLVVKEFDLKFGQDDHKVDVFAVFKEEKRGDIIAIYCDRLDENKDALHYASAHLDKDSLVFIDTKNKSEIVKEFTWKLLNKKENEGFELVDISKYDKVQIVSSEKLILKSEVIKYLYDTFIPKEADKYVKKSRISSSTKILMGGIFIALLVVGAFVVVNHDFVLGINARYTCTNSYLDEATGANKQEIEDLTFDFSDNILSRNIVIRYTFDQKEAFDKYIEDGTYYQYQPVFVSSSMFYEEDNDNLSVDIIEEVKVDEYYTGIINKDELINELTQNGYHCIEEARDDEFLSFLWK